MGRELRVAVIEDDYFKRGHMAQELDRSPHIAVVHALDQDTARSWTAEQWEDLDFAIVDVIDEYAPGEVGTDLFSGIDALERLRRLDVRTLALTPHRHHPLVEHRIYQSGANYLYRWSEVNDLERLVDALLHPDPAHAPTPVSRAVLRSHGAELAKTNLAVRIYEESTLYGRLRSGVTHRGLWLPRRVIDRFSGRIQAAGFDGIDHVGPIDDAGRRPRWNQVRDYLLVLLGRKDAPPTSNDGHP